MGYYISLCQAKFTIKKENKQAVLDCLKLLGNGSNDARALGGWVTELLYG